MTSLPGAGGGHDREDEDEALPGLAKLFGVLAKDGAGGGHTADSEAVALALTWAPKRPGPGGQADGMDALARLEAAANRTASLEAAIENGLETLNRECAEEHVLRGAYCEQIARAEAAEADRDAALAALRPFVKAGSGFMDVRAGGSDVLRLNVTPEALLAARAVLGGPDA